MSRSNLLQALVAFTGDVKPSRETTAAELADLRRAVAQSLAASPPAPAGGWAASADEKLLSELQYLIAHPAADALPSRVLRREAPVGNLTDRSIPDWAAGQAATRTFGPFLDATGKPVWYDVFVFPKRLHVRRGPSGEDFLLLPFAAPQQHHPQLSRVSLSIPAGSVWIGGKIISSRAPGGSYIGVRIKSGTLTIGRLDPIGNDVLMIQPSETITLALVLDPPAKAAPPDGPGAEAANLTADLPDRVTLVLGPAGLHSIQVTGSTALSVYGNDFPMTRTDALPGYDPELRQILVPFSTSVTELTIGQVRSDLMTPAGSARMQRTAWSLPVSISAPAELGDALNAGYLLVTVGPGLRASWLGFDGSPAALSAVDILADPSTLMFLGRADAPGASQTFELWQESASGRSSLEIGFGRRFRLRFFSGAGFDSIQVTGTALAHLDRPVTVSSARLDNPVDVTYALLARPGRHDLFLASTQVPANSRGPIALALKNALLTTTRIQRMSLNGPLTGPDRVDNGVLNLFLDLYQVVPTLPDPYVANFQPALRDAPSGAAQVHAQIAWNAPPDPVLTIELASATGELDSVLPQPVQPARLHRFFGRFSAALRDVPSTGLTLLDVSSNADQLGVQFGLPHRQDQPLAIRDLALSTTALNCRAFLLPQFQWEPVTNVFNPLVKDPPGPLFSRGDGPPTLIGAASVRLVPIAPVPIAEEIVRAYHEDRTGVAAVFTLPFGIEALALLDPLDRRLLFKPDLQVLAPDFPGLKGARELSLRAGLRLEILPERLGIKMHPFLPGATEQTANLTSPPPLDSVLGTLATDFNSTFGKDVPIQRIDFSGYGANIFSNWVNDSQQPVHISQVAFDGIHGRTSYERIQMTSILWPCQATVVRTITIERYGNAALIRWDSGWVATTPGLFRHKDATAVFHPGVVRGMFNIREIRDTDQIVPLDNGNAPVQAVYYDADIEIEGVLRGQDVNGRVPARRQLGFIQRIPVPAGVAGVGALDLPKLNELFMRQNPIGGPVYCTLKLGKSSQQMRVTGIFAQPAPINHFAVAAYGSPVLTGAGHWSVVRVQNAIGKVEPVSSLYGVPLIREGPAANWPGAGPLRWADPADLLPHPNPPEFDYAFLFASQSQRILYARPKVEPNDSNITSALPARLADPYAMLRAGGLFPRVLDAIPFDQLYPLSGASGLLRLVPNIVKFPAPPNFTRPLVDATTWLSDLRYDDGAVRATQFIVDSAKNWDVDIERVSQVLKFDPLGNIMTMVHDIHSPTDGIDSFPKPAMIFDPVLQDVMDILKILASLVPAGDFDGLPAPLKVSLSLVGTALKLSARVAFKLEGEQGQAIDCGIGKVKGELQIGTDVSAEIMQSKFGGQIFIQITGSYQQEIFPLIYGGGQLRFRIGAEETGKATVELDACTVGSVGGSVVPGLIDLEATVKYGYAIRFEGGTFQPGIVLGMEGRAKLLSGMLGFSLGVEARLLMERLKVAPFKVDLRGDILIAGTVTVAWAIHYRKSFHAAFHQELDWKFLVAAGAGLVPIP
jgi:hypothetical protein